jgi:hypothetical protein
MPLLLFIYVSKPRTNSMEQSLHWDAVVAQLFSKLNCVFETPNFHSHVHNGLPHDFVIPVAVKLSHNVSLRFSEPCFNNNNCFITCYSTCLNRILIEMINKMQLCRTIYCFIVSWLLNMFRTILSLIIRSF